MHNNSSAVPSDHDAVSAVAPRPRASLMNIVVDVVRHALPLVPLYAFNGTIASYVLLTAFDLSVGLMRIVATTRDRNDVTTVDPRSRWLISRAVALLFSAIFLAIVSAIIAVPIGMPAFIFGLYEGIDWRAAVSHPGFWVPVACMSLLAAAQFQGAFEATTAPGARGAPTRKGPVIGNLEEDRKRSLAAYAAQVTLIATFACLCYVLITFGRVGFYALPVLYAALLMFYDVRPDIAQRIFPELWRRK